jgi:putative SOS response-associated peptidase YedK
MVSRVRGERRSHAARLQHRPQYHSARHSPGRNTGARKLVGMLLGLVGFGPAGPDPKRATFNSRTDNLERSSLWRTPLHKRRCLVPVSGIRRMLYLPEIHRA